MARMIQNPITSTWEGTASNGLGVRVDAETVANEAWPHYVQAFTTASGPDGQLTTEDNAALDTAKAPVFDADYWAQKAG